MHIKHHIKIMAFMSIFALCAFTAVFAYDEYVGDSAVYSGQSAGVKANILILLDTSGSMTDEVCTLGYSVDTDYTSGTSYSRWAVYRYSSGGGWGGGGGGYVQFVSNLSSITCSKAYSSLYRIGVWSGNIQSSSPYGCGGSTYTLYLGNYLAYKSKGCTTKDKKINIARKAIESLMINMRNADGTDPVNWGLMAFDGTNTGGTLYAPCGTPSGSSTTAGSIIYILEKTPTSSNRFYNPSNGTPVAEMMAEAGLYFAGKASWCHSGTTYTSPIRYRCQKNYIICVSDGASQVDTGIKSSTAIDKNSTAVWSPLFTSTYINSKAIGDYDKDGCDPDKGCMTFENQGTHYLDDVAKFLHDEDLMHGTDDAGVSFDEDSDPTDADPEFSLQNITTYTIGFGDDTSGLPLLQRAAQGDWDGIDGNVPANGNYGGGGKLFYAGAGDDLLEALMEITANVIESDFQLISPVVPVSKMNRLFSGNAAYLGLFKPDSDGYWRGNLKKYGIDDNGNLLQKDGSLAVDTKTGNILPSAKSCWNDIDDGYTVDKGGVGTVMLTQSGRHFYTYDSTNGTALLSGSTYNAFEDRSSGTNITYNGVLGLTSAAQKSDLIDFIRAEDAYGPAGALKLPWVMGDILHSRPQAMYDGNYTILFVGTNDGFMRCFADNGQGTNTLSDDTVTENWCFVPWELLSTLKELHPSYKTNSIHNYFVDGPPSLYTVGSNKYLTFGLRRGGSVYYTLDVGNVNTTTGDLVPNTWNYSNVSFAWKINSNIFGTGGETLGESWCKPLYCKIKTSAGQDGTSAKPYTDAILLAGGYDNANQDLDAPSTSGDSKGRAVFAVNASSGSMLSVPKFSYTGGYTAMKFSIVDFAAFDYKNEGRIDTIYCGDLGGRLFGFNDRDGNASWGTSSTTDNYSPKLIFTATNTGTASTKYLKFFYAPDVVVMPGYDYVYIGTGDREHPLESTTVNRFYAIKNWWANSGGLSESNLANVTNYSVYTSTYPPSKLKGDSCNGWFITLRTGEKVVSSPLVFNGIVYFTTYIPEAQAASVDKCTNPGLGSGYLYALDCQTGEAITALNLNEKNDTGGKIVIDETDRYMKLGGDQGGGMPTAPSLVVTTEGSIIQIGTNKGAVPVRDPTTENVNRYYWRQN